MTTTFRLSQLRELRGIFNDDAGTLREFIDNVRAEETDFEVDTFRCIHEDAIDEVQKEELGNDLYVLGCFNAQFLASATGIPQEAVEALQKAEAYEALGTLIVSMDKLDDVQRGYCSADGYGHHFNHYDFGEEYVAGWYIFNNR